MMLALAFILGFAAYLGAHGHTGAAYLLLGFVVCYLVFRFLAWSIKELSSACYSDLGPDWARASADFDHRRARAQGGFGTSRRKVPGMKPWIVLWVLLAMAFGIGYHFGFRDGVTLSSVEGAKNWTVSQ